MVETFQKKLSDSAAWRWTALVLLASAMFFGYIFVDILSPLKDLLQTQRGWDSVAFGHYAGSEPFLNVFVFFLIFAGIILDKMAAPSTITEPERMAVKRTPILSRMMPAKMRKNTNTLRKGSEPA